MEVISCNIVERKESTKKYDYEFIKTISYNDDTLYIYKFTYNNSGIELTLAMNDSEVLWLVDKYIGMTDKFLSSLNTAFKDYIETIITLYNDGKEDNNDT